MRKRVFKTFAAAALATTIAGTTIIGSTAFADEISTLTQQKQDKQNELDQLQQQAAYLLTEMSSLEQDMADLSDEIDQTNADLEAAQQLQQKQFDDTKLRIKYMYEDQSTSISDVFLTASDMSDVINKASYMQQVYDYDRNKLEEMAATAASIAGYKSDLDKIDRKNLYEYYFGNYDYVKILDKGDTLVNLKSEYGKEYNIKSDRSVKYLKKTVSKDEFKYEYKGKTIVEKGTKKGDKIGTLYISYNDEILDTINITSPEDIKFDLKFFVKEHKAQFVLLTLIVTIVILFINLRRII